MSSFFFFSSRRRHTRLQGDWSSDVCSSDLLKGSAEAMEVAARESATAQGGVHELQDLVMRIARTEKIDESKELAEDIQDSLARRIQKSSKPVKNRGVRKAPFVVLIGADMPSILTEISFLSNPADEQMLKKPEQRQKVAEEIGRAHV